MNTTAKRRCALGLTAIAVLGFAAGCGEDSTGAAKDSGAEAPEAVVCTVGGDYSGEVTAKAAEGSTEEQAGEEFGPMRLSVQYSVWPTESDTVAVVVTDADDRELTRVLYQVGTPLDAIEFQGGHGFTGLHYVTHEDAQLQFWCEAG